VHRALQAVIGLATLVVAGSIAFSAWHLSNALDAWNKVGSGSQTFVTGLNQTMTTVNRPCGGKDMNGKLLADGTLCALDTSIKKVGDILVTSQMQEKDVAKAAQQNMAAVNGLASHLGTVADSLSTAVSNIGGTATAATGALNQARADLSTLDTSIAATKPLIDAGTKTINDADTSFFAKDSHIQLFIAHLDSTSAHVDATTGDLQKVADKTTGDILAPKPWWQKIGPFTNDAIRAGCLLTGRCP
jgi:hypothetical protein